MVRSSLISKQLRVLFPMGRACESCQAVGVSFGVWFSPCSRPLWGLMFSTLP